MVPASAVPLILGLFSLAGEAGSEPVNVGVGGGTVSMVKDHVAGVGSTWPAKTARTCNVWLPFEDTVGVWLDGALQAPRVRSRECLDWPKTVDRLLEPERYPEIRLPPAGGEAKTPSAAANEEHAHVSA